MCLPTVRGKREREREDERERERERTQGCADAQLCRSKGTHKYAEPSFITFRANISLQRWHAYTIAQATMLIINRAKIS